MFLHKFEKNRLRERHIIHHPKHLKCKENKTLIFVGKQIQALTLTIPLSFDTLNSNFDTGTPDIPNKKYVSAPARHGPPAEKLLLTASFGWVVMLVLTCENQRTQRIGLHKA